MADPNVTSTKRPQDMGRLTGHTITALAFGIPLVALLVLGSSIGNEYTAEGFAVIWTGLFIASSLQFVRKTRFVILERFGYFWEVKFAGPRLIIPWIDIVVLQEDFLQKSVTLFEGVDIDFEGGSAPVRAAAWYQIGNPDDIENGRMSVVKDQILKYFYRVRAEDRAARVAEIFQGAFRPYLETKTIAQAQAEAEDLAKKSIEGVPASGDAPAHEGAKVALAEIGVYPFPGKGIIVSDIVLPPAIIELRERELRGKADAEEAINRSRSYWEPVLHMKKGLSAGETPITLSDEDLVRLFLGQRTLETLQKTGSNINLVASDIDSAVRLLLPTGSMKPQTQNGGS